jgi:outer membrane protein TolC
MPLSSLLRTALLGIVGSAATVHADTPLGLRDALAHAIASNPTLASTSFALGEARAAELAERGRYDPRFEAQSSGHGEHTEPRPSPLGAPVAHNSYGASASIATALETGGEARLTIAAQHDTAITRVSDPASSAHVDYRQLTATPRIEASLRAPLWGGRRVGPAARERLAAERDAAALDRIAVASRVVRDVEHAYWQLYLAQQEVAIRRDAAAAAESQLAQVQAEIARGTRPRLAAAEIEDELARRREDALIATGAVGERSLELARLLGAPPTSDLRATDPVPSEPSRPVVAPGDPPQLRAAGARVAAAAHHLVEAEDASSVQLDATLTGSLSTPGERWRQAVDVTGGYGGWIVDAAITLRVPLTDRSARGSVAAAHARWREAQIARADAAAELAADIERWTNRREVARQRRLALQRARGLADDNLSAETKRWQRGDTTSYEVLRRQAAVSDVRLRFERARIDELDADTALAALSGALLDRLGIALR